MKLTTRKSKYAALIATLLMGAALTGCGKQAFNVSESQSELQSPGTYIIPPKVDFLIALDDTGSMATLGDQIKKQFPAFQKTLDDNKWDYRLASIPLTHERTIQQALAAKYDGNWGSQWMASYPGALSETESLPAWMFRTFSTYTDFTSINYSNSTNGLEPGLQTIVNALNKPAHANYFRPDAMLVVLAISNGEDTSGVNYCYDRGYAWPCNDGSSQNSLNQFIADIKAQKPSQSMIKFYANVPVGQGDCSNRFPSGGNRYSQVATALGGKSYDICNQTLTTTLNSLASDLQIQRLNFRTRYLFIAQDANPDSIQVTKYSGGAATVIPRGGPNGWTYHGYQTDLPAIDSPIEMNRMSGYAIELHGSAKLLGTDTADVKFKAAGAYQSY